MGNTWACSAGMGWEGEGYIWKRVPRLLLPRDEDRVGFFLPRYVRVLELLTPLWTNTKFCQQQNSGGSEGSGGAAHPRSRCGRNPPWARRPGARRASCQKTGPCWPWPPRRRQSWPGSVPSCWPPSRLRPDGWEKAMQPEVQHASPHSAGSPHPSNSLTLSTSPHSAGSPHPSNALLCPPSPFPHHPPLQSQHPTMPSRKMHLDGVQEGESREICVCCC